MKRIKKALGQFKEISPEEMQSAGMQALRSLGVQDSERILSGMPQAGVVHPLRRIAWPAVALIAAAIVIAVLIPTRIVQSAPATLEDASGSRKIQFGETVRPTGDKSATLSMADGSRVEARPQSEFSLERAADGGTRIRLNRGSVAVVAAVSEVRVQQGATERRLRSGEQLTSTPVALPPVKDRIAFEVTSIRPGGPTAPPVPGARGADAGANPGANKAGCGDSNSLQLDPRRFAIYRATLFQLIGYAYPIQGIPDFAYFGPGPVCGLLGRTGFFSGGPEWVKTDTWNVEASIPEGYLGNVRAFELLDDPKFKQMLQVLLTERFKVVLRRETRNLPVYLLKVGKDGPKFNGHSKEFEKMIARGQKFPLEGSINELGGGIEGQNVSTADWARHLYLFLFEGWPVLDRTGLTGRFDFHYVPTTPRIAPGDPDAMAQDTRARNRDAVKAMGFELEESRVPFEVIVIERAEKPAEN